MMLRKCFQERCSFNLQNDSTMGLGALACPNCEVCGASSNVVDQDCQTCIDCEGVDGRMRNDSGKGIKQQVSVALEVVR
jgi:hypothetical protein